MANDEESMEKDLHYGGNLDCLCIPECWYLCDSSFLPHCGQLIDRIRSVEINQEYTVKQGNFFFWLKNINVCTGQCCFSYYTPKMQLKGPA